MIRSLTTKPGFVGPAIGTLLSILLAGACLQYLSQEHVRTVIEASARATVDQIAGQGDVRAALDVAEGAGFRVRIIEDSTRRRAYPYVHELSYRGPGPQAGESLSRSRDRADADAWLRGRRKATTWTDGRTGIIWGAGPTKTGATVVVQSPKLGFSLQHLFLLLVGIGGLGLVFWLVLLSRFRERRVGSAVGSFCVAVGVLGVCFYGARAIETIVSPLQAVLGEGGDHTMGLWGAWVYPLACTPMLPLVFFGIAGMSSRGRASPHRVAYSYVFPAVFGLTVLVLLPFAFGVILAFLRYSHGSFTWVGLANFIQILASEDYALTHPLNFYFTLGFTILWTAVNVFLHVAIGLALALVLHRPDLRFKGVYRVLLIIPWAVPSYITALIWKGMFNKQFGLINEVLSIIGIEPIGWFSGFWTGFTANLTTNTWLGFPFMMVVALGALQSIPKDLYEAADVDGATKWQQFRAITLPLLKPALLPAVILGTIWTFNMFNIVYLVSGGQPDGSTDILITEAYRWAFEHERYGYAAAYSFIIFGVLLTYSLLTQRVGRKAKEAQA